MNFPNLASTFLIWIQDPRIPLFSNYGWAVSEIGGKDTEAIPEHVQLMKVYSTELPPVLDRISVSQLNFLFPLFLVLPALPFVFTICVSSLILSGMFNYQPWSCCSNAGIEPWWSQSGRFQGHLALLDLLDLLDLLGLLVQKNYVFLIFCHLIWSLINKF